MDEEFETEVWFENDFTKGPDQKVKVKWGYELEMRSWGIKDLIIIVPEQSFDTIIEDGEGNEFDRTYTIKNCKFRFVPGMRDHFSIHPDVLIHRMLPTGEHGSWELEF